MSAYMLDTLPPGARIESPLVNLGEVINALESIIIGSSVIVIATISHYCQHQSRHQKERQNWSKPKKVSAKMKKRKSSPPNDLAHFLQTLVLHEDEHRRDLKSPFFSLSIYRSMLSVFLVLFWIIIFGLLPRRWTCWYWQLQSTIPLPGKSRPTHKRAGWRTGGGLDLGFLGCLGLDLGCIGCLGKVILVKIWWSGFRS